VTNVLVAYATGERDFRKLALNAAVGFVSGFIGAYTGIKLFGLHPTGIDAVAKYIWGVQINTWINSVYTALTTPPQQLCRGSVAMNKKKLKLIARIFFHWFSIIFIANYLYGTASGKTDPLLFALGTASLIAPLQTLLWIYMWPKTCREELRKGKKLEELKICRELEGAGFRIST
jgi:hypothetical protein